MKKILVVLIATAVLALAMTGVALAKDPDPSQDTPYTFWESNPEDTDPVTPGHQGPPNVPFDPLAYSEGGSNWAYQDASDPNAKLEGSYRDFDVSDTVDDWAGLGMEPKQLGIGYYVENPHGGYTDGTNKCKMCHAVHRASGGFKLMRVDNPDEMCNYCHVGAHRHAGRPAYATANGGIYAENGHTIDYIGGIPDSSVSQEKVEKEVKGEIVGVRRYDPTKLDLYIWSRDRFGRWVRFGPTALFCKNCHQQHNATELIWKPNGVSGYKLLIRSPSGSHIDPSVPYGYTGPWGYSGIGYDPRAKVPEVLMTSANTGFGYTIYTSWQGPDSVISNARHSVWCADCHNLDIGYYQHVDPPMPNDKFHGDRTHSVPYSSYQCYSCHKTNLTTYTATTYIGATENLSDYPHTGAPTSTKLLKDTYDASYEHLDDICNDCHSSVGVRQ